MGTEILVQIGRKNWGTSRLSPHYFPTLFVPTLLFHIIYWQLRRSDPNCHLADDPLRTNGGFNP